MAIMNNKINNRKKTIKNGLYSDNINFLLNTYNYYLIHIIIIKYYNYY